MSQSNATTNGALIVMGTGDATEATNQVGLPEAHSTEALLLQQQQFHNSVTASPAGILRPQQQTNGARNSAPIQSTPSTEAVATAGSPPSVSTDRNEASQAVHGENIAMTIVPLTNQDASNQLVQPPRATQTVSCPMEITQQPPILPSHQHLQLCNRCQLNSVPRPQHGQGICGTCEEQLATQPFAHVQFANNAEMQAIVTPVQNAIQAALPRALQTAATASQRPMFTPRDPRVLIRSL